MITGFLEAVSGYQVRGWAIRSDAPHERLTVVASLGDRILASGSASLFRPDLRAVRGGDGNHAFTLNFDRALAEEELGQLSVCAVSACGQMKLLPRLHLDTIEKPSRAPMVNFSGPRSDLSQYPVFVLGSARSGTSAMAQALLKLPRYCGPEEGHLLDLIEPLISVVRSFYIARSVERSEGKNTLIGQVPPNFFEDGLSSLFVQLARNAFSKDYWVDKTPTYEIIDSASLLRRIWPNARFLFLRRRPIENILSRRRKFPSLSLSQHCRDYARVMQSWANVRNMMTGAAIEIDHLFLARNPQIVAAKLARMLSLGESEALQLEQSLAFDRPERTSDSFGAITALDKVGWERDDLDTFLSTCGPIMAMYGYDTGESYFLPNCEDSGLVEI
jgi:Sulfotransferase family